MIKKPAYCDPCADTQILRATLIDEGDGGKHIKVLVCDAHYSNDKAKANILAMHNATGLNVDIVVAKKKQESYDE